MQELGSSMPHFELPGVGDYNKLITADFDKQSEAYLIMFLCNHCPFVIHIQTSLAKICADFMARKVGVIGINANDIERFPEDRPEKMAVFATENNFSFPYLFDESQEVAKAFGAACTPDFFLYDKQKKLVYRGQMDDSRPGNSKENNGKDLQDAVNRVLAGEQTLGTQHPSMGCNIKWKPGNEPKYFLSSLK